MSEREPATYQIQNRYLHHTLIEVCCTVLDNLDSNDFLRLEILALHNLAKGSLTQHIENEIPVSMSASIQWHNRHD